MRLVTILVITFTAVAAVPATNNIASRIVGGNSVAINQWPLIACVLFTWNSATYEQQCGGTILNGATILTAAHCIRFQPVNRFRVRAGSAFASSGGTVHNAEQLIPHPFYNPLNEDHDIGIIRMAITFNITPQIQPAKLADLNYKVRDNELVHALGWGAALHGGSTSEQLRVVQIWTINQEDCARRYSTENVAITDNMLCAGWQDVGGRGQCQGDGGSPLLHNGTVVGVFSFSINCGVRFYPGVNTRVSRFFDWIESNL